MRHSFPTRRSSDLAARRAHRWRTRPAAARAARRRPVAGARRRRARRGNRRSGTPAGPCGRNERGRNTATARPPAREPRKIDAPYTRRPAREMAARFSRAATIGGMDGREVFTPGVPGLPPGASCRAVPKKPPAEAGDSGSNTSSRTMPCGPEPTNRRKALRHGRRGGFHARCPRVATRGFLGHTRHTHTGHLAALSARLQAGRSSPASSREKSADGMGNCTNLRRSSTRTCSARSACFGPAISTAGTAA